MKSAGGAALIDERDFDAIFDRIQSRNIAYRADPYRRYPNEIHRYGGGRGVYFEEPGGHFLEIIYSTLRLGRKSSGWITVLWFSQAFDRGGRRTLSYSRARIT